jgi:hypothetical protein
MMEAKTFGVSMSTFPGLKLAVSESEKMFFLEFLSILLFFGVIHCQKSVVVLVAVESESHVIGCDSKNVPVWNWLGKVPEEMKTLAIGAKKQVRFVDPR